MAVFAILTPEPSPMLGAAVTREFPDDHFVLAPNQFIVSAANVTTREIGERIGDKGEVGQVLVLPVQNWWGWHRKDLWEWLNAKSKP